MSRVLKRGGTAVGGRRKWSRQLILVIAVVLAWAAAMHSGSFIFQSRQPTLALWFDADNPVALVRSATANIAAGTDEEGGGARAIAAARRSVAQNPLNADAFGLYGLVGMASAETGVLSRQLAMADRLSRRDLGTQLFLIEDAVRRNDVAAALRHYDTAMRIEESVRPTLFPILTEAMREPAIRKRFLPYMTAENPWLEPFTRYAIGNASEPSTIVALAIEAGGFPDRPQFATRTLELLSVLVGNDDYATARRVYETLGKGDPALLTDPQFSEATTKPGLAPYTWQPIIVGDIDPIFLAGSGAQLELEARLGPGFTNHILRRIFAFAPGTYAIAVPMRADGYGPDDAVQLQVLCAGEGGGTPILSESRPMADETTFRASFTVPPSGCGQQMLRFTANNGSSQGDIDLTIGSPTIARR